jgi:hypothetical protein
MTIRPSLRDHPRQDSSRGKRSFVADLLLGAPHNSLSRQVSNWAPAGSVQRWAYRFPLAYALWRELRNSLRRTSDLHEIGAVDTGLQMEMIFPRCRVGSDEYQARIEGIRNLQKGRPWASLFDELLFLEGLSAGLEFQHRSCKSKSRETPFSASEVA